jgi:hypothetical protein
VNLEDLDASIVPIFHGSPSTNSDRQLHLLPRVWEGSQTTRPALCGQRRVTWKSIHQLATKATDWPICEGCAERAEAITHPAAPRPIALAAPTRGRTSGLPIEQTVTLPNTQAERVARRVAFRDSFALSHDASTYLIRRDYAPGMSNQS